MNDNTLASSITIQPAHCEALIIALDQLAAVLNSAIAYIKDDERGVMVAWLLIWNSERSYHDALLIRKYLTSNATFNNGERLALKLTFDSLGAPSYESLYSTLILAFNCILHDAEFLLDDISRSPEERLNAGMKRIRDLDPISEVIHLLRPDIEPLSKTFSID